MGSITKILNALNIHSVQPNIEKTNNTEGFAATMLPLLIVLASWVGTMIMSLNLNSVQHSQDIMENGLYL